MRVGKIEQCVCAKEDLIASGYSGMPVIRFYGGADQSCEIKCPDCGRGGILQFTSVYKALKDWNDMQNRLKDNTPLFYPCEEKEVMQNENPGGN